MSDVRQLSDSIDRIRWGLLATYRAIDNYDWGNAASPYTTSDHQRNLLVGSSFAHLDP
jgi:hypothetical protein